MKAKRDSLVVYVSAPISMAVLVVVVVVVVVVPISTAVCHVNWFHLSFLVCFLHLILGEPLRISGAGFSRSRCSSCHPTNIVRALEETQSIDSSQ